MLSVKIFRCWQLNLSWSVLLAPSLSPETEDQGLLWGVREVMGLRPAGFKFGEGLNLAASI